MLEDHSPSLTFLSDEKDDEFLRRGEGSLPNIQRNHNFATAELWQRIPTNKYSTYIYIHICYNIYIYLHIFIYHIDMHVHAVIKKFASPLAVVDWPVWTGHSNDGRIEATHEQLSFAAFPITVRLGSRQLH